MESLDRPVRQAFVLLSGRLVANFDAMDYLDTLARLSVDLLDVSASGVLLADRRGVLRPAAASTGWPSAIERSEPHDGDDPGVDAYRNGSAVWSSDLAAEERWPSFTTAARTAGFNAVHALPMRVHREAVGAMSLLSAQPGRLDAEAAELAQALADQATIAVLNERANRRAVVNAQLQHALNSRVLIEQAKGVLAERLHVPVDVAFSIVRGYARRHRLKLAGVARAVVTGELRNLAA